MGSRHTDTTDIRAWLRENRPDLGVQPRGALKASALEAYRESNPDDSRETSDGAELPGAEQPGEGQAGHRDEVPPEQPAGSRPWFGKRPAGAPRVKSSHRRVPVDGLFSMAWGALGKLASSPATYPVGRVMQLQAPAAGMVLDEALKGSIIDRMAQPLARGAKRGEAVFAVVGPPLLVGAICQRPELYPVVRPMLVEALTSWLVLSGPKIRRARERERKLLEELDGLDVGDIGEMIDALFAPPGADEAEGPTDADATPRAA